MEIALVLVGLVIGWFAAWFIRPYAGEKAKNLATKQDIAGITRTMESVRSEFTSQNERLRSELRVIAHQHETRFARLHERRAEAIDGLYKRLARTQAAFYRLSGGPIGADDSVEKRKEWARGCAQKLFDYSGEHQLYYDPELMAELDNFEGAVSDAWHHFSDEDIPAEEYTPVEREYIVKERQRAFKIVRDLLPRLRHKIEKHMRKALGDERTD